MEDEFETTELNKDFAFLNRGDMQAHFADVNISLLSGKHIQTGEGYLFTILDNYRDELGFFYQTLYGLKLRQGRVAQTDYYYLDFPEEGKGRLTSSSRFREMTGWEVLITLMLLNMYYDRFFDQSKIISWTLIRKEIDESELTPLYRKAFFNDAGRENFSDAEWKFLQDNFKRVIRTLDHWGWVRRISQEEEDGELIFEIRESINRFGQLYQYEISDFEGFITQFYQRKQKS